MELKRFSLKNLYGYKNIELVFNNEATIIIAENGAGKTTLINSLNAVLRGNADELRKLKCDSIEIDFKDKSYEINISELNFSDFLATAPLPTQFLKMMSFLKPSQIDDLLHDIKSRSVREIRESRNKEWYRLIYNSTPYGYSEIDNILTNIKRLLNNHYSQQLDIFQNHELGNGNQKNKSTLALEEIKNRMRNFDIIYLPTYRRIEKATLRDKYTIESDEKMQFRDGELGFVE